MNHLTRLMTATSICSAAVLLAAPGAHAQDGTDTQPESTAERDAGGIDTIIVTARRREESLQDVPVAVSAFDDDRLTSLQADDISGIQYTTPNLYLDQGDASNAVIFLRGIGQNDSLAFADPGVGVYVDDVFIARSQAAFLELFDVERIEVLRGPQGTLYGRNTIGGAVKFVSAPPPDELEAYLELGKGNYDMLSARGRIGGPLIEDRLSGKAAFAFTKRDGYNDNVFTGEDDGDVESFSGRAGLLFTPSDRVEFYATVDAKKDRPDTSRSPVLETSITGTPDPSVFPTELVTFEPPSDSFEVNTNANGLSDLSAWGSSLRSTFEVSDVLTIEAITSYREMDFDLNLDTDGSPLPILDILVEQDQSQFSQEVRATYEADALSVVAGVYYFEDQDETFSGVDNGSATVLGFPVTLFGFATSSLALTDQDTESIAAFFDATFDLTDRLSLSGGLRYTHEEKRSSRDFEAFFDPTLSVLRDTPAFLAGEGVPTGRVEGEEDFEAFTPKFTASFDASEDVMVYASASRGFKSGGFDGRANTDLGFTPFDPEFVWSYEAGVKSTLADGRLVANAAYFYNDYTDLQVTSFAADPNDGTFISQFTNAGAATIQGVELELFGRVSDELTITGTMGYLDAQYDKFDILVAGEITDVSGRPLVNAPKWNGSVALDYEKDFAGNLTGLFHIDAAYRGERATEITASEELTQDGHEIVNALVGLKSTDERWELRFGVQNLTDQDIRVQGFNLSEFPGVQVGFFAAPRTYDARLVLRY
jgi:iron complex outermembrane receptor protein